MELADVIPWGRSINEYKEMFSLTHDDLKSNILACADGPASFNAELSSLGNNIVSVDPIYQFDEQGIGARIAEVYPQIMEQVAKNKDDIG